MASLQFLITAVDRTAGALRSAERGVDRLVGSVRHAGMVITGLGATIGVGFLASASKRLLDQADAWITNADAIGITVEQLQRYAYAAKLTNIEQEQLQSTLETVARKAGAKDFASLEAVLNGLAKRMGEAASQTEKFAIAASVSSRGGAAVLVKLFGDGGKFVKEAGDELERFNGILGRDVLVQAARAADKFDSLWFVLKQKLLRAIVELTPQLIALADATAAAIPVVTDFFAKIFARDSYLAAQQNKKALEENAASIDRVTRALEGYRRESQQLGAIQPFEAIAYRANRIDDLEQELRALEKTRASLQPVPLPPMPKPPVADVSGLLGGGGGGRSDRDRALEEARRNAERLDDLAQRVREQVNPIEAVERELLQLDELYATNRITLDQYAKATFDAWDQMATKTEAETDAMTQFAIEAARNMQDAFSSFFFEVMQGNFEGLAQSFKATIDRMVADFLASELLKFLVGDFGKTGQIGGILAGLFGGGKAGGGPVSGGRAYLVGETGPELFVPGMSGRILSNAQLAGAGGVTVNMTIQTPDADSFRRSSSEVQSSVARMVRSATARHL